MKKSLSLFLSIIILVTFSCKINVLHTHEWVDFECTKCGMNYYSTAKLGDLILKDGTICKPKDFNSQKVNNNYYDTIVIFREAKGDLPALGTFLMGVYSKEQWCNERATGASEYLTALAGDLTSGLTDGSQAWSLLVDSCKDALENPEYYCIREKYSYLDSLGPSLGLDWYIPTANELYSLYLNKDEINNRLISEMNYDNFSVINNYLFMTCNQDPNNDENFLYIDFSNEGKLCSLEKWASTMEIAEYNRGPYNLRIKAFNNKTSHNYFPEYKFTEDIIELPLGTDGSGGKEAEYVLFGDFPQSKADPSINFNKCPTENGYYVGSDGNYYAYHKSNYFKVEPIKWRILTDNYDYDGASGNDTAKLLLAENVLIGSIPFYEDSNNKHRNNSYPNNYEHSQIRAYLNGLDYDAANINNSNTWYKRGFYQKAFTTNARKLINTTVVDNSALSTTDTKKSFSQAKTYACNNTNDKVFLLSIKEVTTSEYGFADYNTFDTQKPSGRNRSVTDYTECARTTSGEGNWWLRSPVYNDSGSVQAVWAFGYLVQTWPDTDLKTVFGIVPAITISSDIK